MRFINTVHNPQRWDKQTVSKFAFLPISIGSETRWFETVTIEQEYQADGCSGGSFSGWVNKRFVDKGSDYVS